MDSRLVRFPTVGLTNTLTTKLYQPPTTTGGTNVPPQCTNCYWEITHIHVSNTSTSPVAVTLGLSGDSSILPATSIQGNSYVDYYGNYRLDAANSDYLSGGAATGSVCNIFVEGYMGISG